MSIKPPSWNEIRQQAAQFTLDYCDKTDENAYAQAFWIDFLNIFGIDHKRVRARFEQTAKRESTGGRGRIDMFWPRLLIVEHKSAGKNLEQAEEQALDYLQSIDQEDWPIYVVTSNFHSMRIKRLDTSESSFEFPLTELVQEIDRFGFLAGYDQRSLPLEHQAEANVEAARLMGRLYEEVSRNGYSDHEASILLMRILFLLFGDDTGMWEMNLFDEFLRTRTNQDGTDLGPQLTMLFQTLDKPEDQRSQALDDLIRRFPYVNGGLYKERLDIPTFTKAMRDELLVCSAFNWGVISPAIFGSMFQSIKSAEARRELGEHYTSEINILKLIRPLFLDELEEEFEKSKDQIKKLQALLVRLSKIRVFDPACGCGNFLIVAYRELRSLELKVLVRLRALTGDDRLLLDASMNSVVRLDHFFGIEIEEWPAEIAEVAMFLVDHQSNLELAKEFGLVPSRLPINVAATIVRGNALRMDWNTILPITDDVLILGNPPFIGMYLMTEVQQQDRNSTFLDFEEESSRTGRLDYVTSWYAKAISTVKGKNSKCAFVSTNSITQGEQARTLGPLFASTGFEIDFAFPTFYWTSDSSNAAAVHVVIIGFSEIRFDKKKTLHFVNDDDGNITVKSAKHINFYLIDGPEIELVKRKSPIVAGLPDCTKGSQPTDGGNLFFKGKELVEARKDPIANTYLKRFIGATELLYNEERFCLWLVDAKPQELHSSSLIKKRLEAVASMRRESPTKSVQEQANTPSLFTQIRQPKGPYFALPCVSSERREYIPGAFFDENSIAGNGVLTFPNAPLWLFGYLQSKAFTEWVATFSGRLKSDFQIHPAIVYFTFPFVTPDASQRLEIERLSQDVLDARIENVGANLASLYDPLTMPSNLRKAHNALDKYIDGMYRKSPNANSAERLNLLMEKYKEILENERLV